MTTRIRRYVETDTGHRVPNHKSKCRHFHGHRYRFEAEIGNRTIAAECQPKSDVSFIPLFCRCLHILLQNKKMIF